MNRTHTHNVLFSWMPAFALPTHVGRTGTHDREDSCILYLGYCIFPTHLLTISCILHLHCLLTY